MVWWHADAATAAGVGVGGGDDGAQHRSGALVLIWARRIWQSCMHHRGQARLFGCVLAEIRGADA